MDLHDHSPRMGTLRGISRPLWRSGLPRTRKDTSWRRDPGCRARRDTTTAPHAHRTGSSVLPPSNSRSVCETHERDRGGSSRHLLPAQGIRHEEGVTPFATVPEHRSTGVSRDWATATGVLGRVWSEFWSEFACGVIDLVSFEIKNITFHLGMLANG